MNSYGWEYTSESGWQWTEPETEQEKQTLFIARCNRKLIHDNPFNVRYVLPEVEDGEDVKKSKIVSLVDCGDFECGCEVGCAKSNSKKIPIKIQWLKKEENSDNRS